MLMVSAAAGHTDWQSRFLLESEENARLRSELEETRAKYDALLEASLQQMASRMEEYSTTTTTTTTTTERFNPIPTSNPLPPLPSLPSLPPLPPLPPLPSSVASSYPPSTASSSPHSATLAISMSDDTNPLVTSSSSSNINEKKQIVATPKKKKEGGIFAGFIPQKKKDKKEKDLGFTLDENAGRTDFTAFGSASFKDLPRLEVCPLVSQNHVVISGPNGPVGPILGDDSGSAHYSDIAAGRSDNSFENRVIAAVADGCNWGAKPRDAAQRANAAFVEYVNDYHKAITDVKKAGAVLLNAFEAAHNSIMEGKIATWDAGTTTLLGGVLLEINKGDDPWTPQWEFVCASVGDCKAFCYSSSGEIIDITRGNRPNTSDPRDCGGRLGPHDEGRPDLRNLNIFCESCQDGDLIIIVTDGIHDNLDPQHLGKLPKDMPKEFNLVGDKWDDVDPAKAIHAKNTFTTELLLRLLQTGEETPTPQEVADRLVNHCIEVTQKSREAMENNNGRRLPEDYIEYPGKMDHTSCLCFRVGRFPTLPEKETVPPSSSLLIASASSSNLTISALPSLANSNGNNNNGNGQVKQDDGSPRGLSSPTATNNINNPKFDNWTKISPSIKHSN